tara:strand:+ start:65 stop:2509 length:2445 start_codon:yes stop_codon:yes gene_type:complete
MNGLLSAKQPNMSIHASSTAFAEIVDGNKIKITRLTTNEVAVDLTSTTLAEAISSTCSFSGGVWTCVGKPLQSGDVLIIDNATDAQQRSWILNGNANGDSTDFTRLQTDYDDAVIKAMFSAGQYLDYDTASGVFSVNTGTGAQDLGAQTLPMDSTKFQILDVSNSNVEFALLALEGLIQSVDNAATGGTTTVTTRLDNLSGVTGSNLSTFSGGVFNDNSTIKAVLQQSEGLHVSSTQDRAAIRSEAAAQATTEATALGNEVTARQNQDSNLQQNIDTLSNTQVADKNTLTQLIGTNNTARIQAENALDSRLDTVEGDDTTVGSIAHAQKAAQDHGETYTDQQVAAETNARTAAFDGLQLQVLNLQQGDIKLVGLIHPDNTIQVSDDLIGIGDTRNGQNFDNVELKSGEEFIFSAATTLTYSDGSTEDYDQRASLLVVNSRPAGAIVEADVNVVASSVTALQRSNVGGSTIELDGSDQLVVIDDSIGRTKLDNSVEADIDDKRSLTQNNAITSASDSHIVTDIGTGADQNMYYKRTSNTTDALTGTKRAVLGELFVSTNGSGNPAAPVYAHTATYSTHYNGNCVDLSVAIGGINAEANANATSNIYATGVYALAMESQLGINAGVTGVAQGAGISNIGVTGFGQTGGAGKDRGGVFSLADVDFITYAGLRSVNPIDEPDVALIADAGYAPTSKAFVAVGDTILDGGLSVTGDADFSGSKVDVPNATEDSNAVNLGDIKAREAIYEFDLTDGVAKDVPTTLDLNKVLWRVVDDSEGVTVDVQLDTSNSKFVVTATGGSLTDVTLLVQQLSCSVTSV